jgi:glutamate synthase (NADPH/NADH) small chain
MGKDTGFLEHAKQDVPRRPIPERVRDFREYDVHYSEQEIRTQASRCMDCGIPFCHTGCPLGNQIPDWNDLVYRGNWKEALDNLHSTNNFPEFTGRICPAPCEESCVLNAYYTLDPQERQCKKNSVTIEQIEKHIADQGWENGWVTPQPPKQLTGKRVAVIGSGPAGLAAAQQLRRAGHDVTVYEKDDRIGGLLIYGIPDFKLEKIHVQRRVDQMQAEGVQFITKCQVGQDITVEELRSQFDAILLATGAQHARSLTTEGAGLKGVHYAMDYLPQRNRFVAGEAPRDTDVEASGKTAAILGGGFTAADCLGNLNRQGANRRVHQFEIVNMQPRPTPVHEEAEPDCRANILTEKVLDDGQGNVSGLQAVRVEWVPQEGGRPQMQRIEGSEFTIEVDMVLLAMGFLGPKVDGLLDGLGVQMNVRGKSEPVPPETVKTMLENGEQPMFHVSADNDFRTSVDGVFVAGDAKRGASLVVWAIWEGREAARSIDTYLMGTSALPTSPQAEVLA